MACCLTAPSHYLNQCWLIISEVIWHSPENNFAVWMSKLLIIIMGLNIILLKLRLHFPGAYEFMRDILFNFECFINKMLVWMEGCTEGVINGVHLIPMFQWVNLQTVGRTPFNLYHTGWTIDYPNRCFFNDETTWKQHAENILIVTWLHSRKFDWNWFDFSFTSPLSWYKKNCYVICILVFM